MDETGRSGSGFSVLPFGITNPLGSGDEGNVPALLRRAATVLEAEGAARVLDVTLHYGFTEDADDWYSLTTYSHRLASEDWPEGPRKVREMGGNRGDWRVLVGTGSAF